MLGADQSSYRSGFVSEKNSHSAISAVAKRTVPRTGRSLDAFSCRRVPSAHRVRLLRQLCRLRHVVLCVTILNSAARPRHEALLSMNRSILSKAHALRPDAVELPRKRSAVGGGSLRWWQTAVVYQVYPRSFQDSDADGVGDLRGIEQRLDYLVELGIDAIWLSPVFPSPMADFGYDISDYTDIDPLFGTLADFDALLAAAHARGIRLIMDLVPNHTSDQHPWFVESRAGRNSPKRDWYLWRLPARDGGPPNNWKSEFGGSAWEYDPHTAEYYYHAFLARQPDLNWRNPDVRSAIYDVMRFWFRRGVDGFRIDVIWHLVKDELFRDNPANPEFRDGDPSHRAVLPFYTADRPEVHDIVAEMRAVSEEFPERLLIGEIYLPIEKLMAYYGRDLRGLHLPFNFSLLSAPWDARSLAALIADYEAALPSGGWPNWVLGNHDKARIATRVGAAQAPVAAMLLLTLRGTPTIYYGDEIGMQQVDIPPGRLRDPAELNQPGRQLGRDGCRTPMPWDGSACSGFSSAEPWLPLAADHAERCVALQIREPCSIWQLYRNLIRLRHDRPALSIGAFRPLACEDKAMVYMREHADDCLIVALNLGSEATAIAIAIEPPHPGRLLLSSYGDRQGEMSRGRLDLRPDEGIIVDVLKS
jgi:alpha-glucosidase